MNEQKYKKGNKNVCNKSTEDQVKRIVQKSCVGNKLNHIGLVKIIAWKS